MKNSNVLWALTAGLAIGYILGNKIPMSSGGGGTSAPTHTAENVPSDLPKDWITEKELGAESSFAGLTAAQRYGALKVLNSKPCDCGCPHGTIAKCKKEDPACPVAPVEIATAAREAKAGKSYEEIYAAVKKSDAPAAPAHATTGKVLLAAWTPIHGPKYAKVTVLEFSDFQ